MSSHSSLHQPLQIVQNMLRTQLDQYYDRSPEVPTNLREAMEYSLFLSGKRIRPRLLLHTGELFSIPEKVLHPWASALEIFHCFTLIHDDLPCLDNDDYRRGKPSNHKIFGDGLALLAGDGLHSLCAEIALHPTGTAFDAKLLETFRLFLRFTGVRGVIGGQAQEFLLHSESTFIESQTVHQLKTGALFSAACLIPALLAGVKENSREYQTLKKFSHDLGFAFQVADDFADLKQDTDAKAQLSPKNILSFMRPDEVQLLATESLKISLNLCSEIWGNRSQGLHALALEVFESLQFKTEIPTTRHQDHGISDLNRF